MHKRIKDLFENFYPNYRGEDQLFQSHVDKCLCHSSVVLDAGCGSGRAASHDLRMGNRVILGIDMDNEIAKNRSIDHAARGTLEMLPLKDNSVDLILCRYVLEHVERPNNIFSEFYRVLRVKGEIVLLTPNLWHYVTLVSRLASWRVHRWFKEAYGIAEEDTFKTFYRANTGWRLKRLAAQSGFRVETMEMLETSPNYLEFSRILYRVGVVYERVVNSFPVFSFGRVNIVATLVKEDI